MKLLIILVAIAGLFLLPITGFSAPMGTAATVVPAEQNTTAVEPPPVAQSLVREGNFAVKLAVVLDVGTPQSETSAESMLASIGIAPNNGWITDYPVTPAIIEQLQNSIQAAVNSGKLAMPMDIAMEALQTVSDDFGLNIGIAGASSDQTAGEPTPGSNVYTSPTVVNNYYYDYGPPIITYYSPPPAYFYLYAWVPSPFWCAGFYFPGFFILNDFDTDIVVHHRSEICTNHVFDPRTHRFLLIDPVNGRHYRSVREFPHFNRFEAGKGGEAIYHHAWASNRNGEHGLVPGESSGRDLMSSGSGQRYREHSPDNGMGYKGFNSRFHDGHFEDIPNGGTGHGFGGGFHGSRYAGIPGGRMNHGFGSGFHGGDMGHGFSAGFNSGGFRH
jgi:hypothetical protein